MTLRCELSIIPFGNESDKEVIHTINISNLFRVGLFEYEYGVEVDKYKTQEYDLKVIHNRSDGALALVHKALGKYLEGLKDG